MVKKRIMTTLVMFGQFVRLVGVARNIRAESPRQMAGNYRWYGHSAWANGI